MNLDEVAKLAGVSTATVSRVLNNVSVVSNETRAKVLRAVKELNYHPNLHAKSLAGRKTDTLGIIVSNLENPFFFDIFHALEASAHEGGYEVLISNTDYLPAQLLRSVRTMIGRRVDGLALVVSEMESQILTELAQYRSPVVFYDVGTPGENIARIRVNYRKGIEELVGYLHELGHRRLAFVGHHSSLSPTNEREQAFVEAASQLGCETTWRTVANQDGLEGGRRAAAELLGGDFAPTAIVCVNDLMAVGVLRELRARGLLVPHDVSVTGFDNIELADFSDPPLTTMNIPRRYIGQLMFSLLVPEGQGNNPPAGDTVLMPELILRASTGPAPSWSGQG
jgi:LacI family transcriptional regulator